MSKPVKAWHFLADTGLLRDGSAPPPDGEPLIHTDPVIICRSGLHASRRCLDAISYAPGSIVCRVLCEDIRDERGDKLVCAKRTILWRLDATEVLRDFARRCALDVVHLWDAPWVVINYLKTGDESLRAAAAASGGASYSATSYSSSYAAAVAYSSSDQWAHAASYAAAVAYSAYSASVSPSKQNRRLTSMLVAAHRKEQS